MGAAVIPGRLVDSTALRFPYTTTEQAEAIAAAYEAYPEDRFADYEAKYDRFEEIADEGELIHDAATIILRLLGEGATTVAEAGP